MENCIFIFRSNSILCSIVNWTQHSEMGMKFEIDRSIDISVEHSFCVFTLKYDDVESGRKINRFSVFVRSRWSDCEKKFFYQVYSFFWFVLSLKQIKIVSRLCGFVSVSVSMSVSESLLTIFTQFPLAYTNYSVFHRLNKTCHFN